MMQTLLLVDGSSYLYRAFHALPDLRNRQGEPTGAIYGIVAMLRKLRQDYPAEYSACVFDAKGKTFRDDMYADYKATRKSMPEDLAAQIEPIHALVRALGWPLLEVEGIEADDVIGTLSKKASAAGLKTVVSTGDKDLAQLVDAQVSLINTMSNEVLDEAGVLAKFGVTPSLIVDYLTLIGDTVDNVPGVPKVGPKTAVKWLTQYGNLEGVIANAGSIGGVVGENLRQTLAWLPTARELVTVRCDADLTSHLESIQASLIAKPEDEATIATLYERYGFRSWLKAAGGEPAPSAGSSAGKASALLDFQAGAAASPGETRYESIRDLGRLEQYLAQLRTASLVAFDTETTSLDPMDAQLVGMSFCTEPGVAAYLPLTHRGMEGLVDGQVPLEAALSVLRPWLEDESAAKVGQHLKYDAHVLANLGITLRGIVHDTLLQSYVLESHRNHGLEDLARRHLNRDVLAYEAVCGKGANQLCFDQVSIEAATAYAAEDADLTLQVHQLLWPHIEKDQRLTFVYRDIELPTSKVLHTIERNGVLIDGPLLTAQSSELALKLASLEERAVELAGQPFNLNSPKQIGEIFFERLKLPVIKKTAGGTPSTDEEVLQKLAEDFPLPKLLLEYRALSKLKSTYTDKLPKMIKPNSGRVHTNYAQAVAVTGRLASNDPNLQNIPIRTAEGRRVREAFVAPSGHRIVSADYSQIELRIMAHISGDTNLINAFARGEDVHRHTAAEVFGVAQDQVTSEQRRYAKVINFGLIYGMSAFGLASNLGIERDAARLYIDRYFTRYPGVAHYMQETRVTAKQRGYVETVFGRRLWLPEINSPNGPRRAGAERAAINAPMQGTAADLIKLSMIATQNWIDQTGAATRMVMQVHDELVLEVPNAEVAMVEQELPRLMASVADLAVPLTAEVGVGANWDEAH
jgi:DNA polymerase-1